MTRRALPLLVLLAALALLLAACGGGNGESATTSSTATTASGGGGGSTVKISADPGGALKFEQTSVEATAGKVTIDFTNDSSLSHDVKIEGNGVEDEGTDQVTGGRPSRRLALPPGRYTVFCSFH